MADDKQTIHLPGEEPDDGDVELVEGSVWEIRDTTLADRDLPKTLLRRKLSEMGDDLGDGFVMHNTPVLVTRDLTTGAIIKTTPLNELPGVEWTAADEEALLAGQERETLHPISRQERTKLVEVLSLRLLRWYKDTEQMANRYRFNPVRDGIPELPAGAPAHLAPLPGTPLYPATEGQVMDYLRRFIGSRAEVINKNRFGPGYKDDVRDLALRIS